MAEWNLWQGMDALRREIDRAFENVGGRSAPMFSSAFLPGRAARAYPLMNLCEDKETLYLEALAPGIDPSALQISVQGNTMTISGEKRRLPGDIKPEAFHRSERATGRFTRTITLPVEVDDSKIEANYQHGILMVQLPKAEKAKPRQINVQVA
jgi:HSP20 family protein